MLHSARYVSRRFPKMVGKYTVATTLKRSKAVERRTQPYCKSFQRIFVFFYQVSVLTVYFTKELKLNDSQTFHFQCF